MNRGKGAQWLFGRFVNENSSQNRRRTIVVIMYLSLVANAFSGLAGPTLSDTVGGWIWWFLGPAIGVGLPLTILTFSALRFSTQSTAADYPSKMDERQRSVNYKAHYYSYYAMGYMTIIVMTYLLIEFQIESLWLPAKDDFIYFYVSVTWFFVTFPTAITAWTEPVPETGFEEDRYECQSKKA